MLLLSPLLPLATLEELLVDLVRNAKDLRASFEAFDRFYSKAVKRVVWIVAALGSTHAMRQAVVVAEGLQAARI